MKSILHLKGIIKSIDPDFAYVLETKTNNEYKFYYNELKNYTEGDKVDLLVSPGINSDSVSKLLSIKETKKVKPLKMANFNTLVSHMIKTKERLKATIDVTDDVKQLSDLKEKIEWLEKGITLFS